MMIRDYLNALQNTLSEEMLSSSEVEEAVAFAIFIHERIVELSIFDRMVVKQWFRVVTPLVVTCIASESPRVLQLVEIHSQYLEKP